MKTNTKAENDQELLWWVDENDHVLGSVNRKKAHDGNIIHREVALMIYDENAKVLFQKRNMNKRSMPGFWSTSVAGHIEYGHTADEDVMREAEEEVGLVGFELEFRQKAFTAIDNERYFKYWYEVQVPSNFDFVVNKNEIDEIGFVDQVKIEKMIKSGEKFNPVFVDYVKNFWRRNI